MKKFLKIILFLVVINLFEISNISAAANPYVQIGPYGTNCTWYAWNMANEKAGVILPGWGNAKNWYNDAKNAGYTVGTIPKANSIIVWGGWTSYGHVGYVESVEDNVIHVWDSTGPCIDEEEPEYIECMANGVSEESDKICKANAKRIACEYTISPDLYGITGYIYLDYAPVAPTPSPSQPINPPKQEETPVIVPKSSNANLSNIILSNGTIEFNKDVFEYNLEVENEIEVISINAISEDEKATINGLGDYQLNIGLNEIKLTVTAEDSSIKEYVVKVTRKEKIEEIDSSINDSQLENSNESEEAITKNNRELTTIIMVSICLIFLILFSVIFIFYKKNHNKQ